MAAEKKPSRKKIDEELARAASDYNEICHALHRQMLWNLASHLKMAPEELEEEFAALT